MGIALVTGCASGIGAALRLRLEKQGDRVIGVDLRGAEVEADLSTFAGRQRAVEEALLGLCKRRLVAFDGTRYTPVEAEKETLDFYARSIRHLIG